MRIKRGDTVKIITGEHKGKEGKVGAVLRNKDKVIVEGINIVKKHVKPNAKNETGGILDIEAPIHISNIKLITKKEKEDKKEKTTKKTKTTKKESKK